MKRIFKILGITLLLIVIAVLAIPFVFQKNIKTIVQETINNQIKAEVDFGAVDLSLFRSFPKASAQIENLVITNKSPFLGDTLVAAKMIAFDLSIKELFKGPKEAILVNTLQIDRAKVNLQVDSLGRANYDIAKKSSSGERHANDQGSSGFGFELEHYEINHSYLTYVDKGSKLKLEVIDLNHSGNGSFSGTQMQLDTKTDTQISLESDGNHYLKKNTIDLHAKLILDLATSRYTFQENEGHINRLPLKFDGFVQLNAQDIELALSFENPGSDFKEFLALAPATYTQRLDEVNTRGNFKIKGLVNGKIDDTHIPKMDINIRSDHAAFKFPQLPKKVDDIQINTSIKNETGLPKDTYVNLDKLAFRIDEDRFSAHGTLRHITDNIQVDMTAQGTLNLANLSHAYPVKLEQGQELEGLLQTNLTTSFDKVSLDKAYYQNIKSTGSASIADFKYRSKEVPNAIQITKAHLAFSPETIALDQMTAITGKSDLHGTGKIDNLMGFLFSKQELKGVFDIASYNFSVDDFMVKEEQNSEAISDTIPATAVLKIPAFLEATLNFEAQKVHYDNLTLSNAKGTVIIKDETAQLQNVTAEVFDGSMGFNGKVSTQESTPTFDMTVAMNEVNIAQSFQAFDIIKNIAPIAGALQGNLTTNLAVGGNLNDDLTPKLNSLRGVALANVLNAKIDSKKAPLVANLNQNINFLNLDQLNLQDLETKLNFSDGKVKVTPFDFMLQDIKVTASGSHGFDQQLDHRVQLQIPSKYLEDQLGGLLSELSEQDQKNMKVMLPVGLSGSFESPTIQMDMKKAIGELSQRIIAKQKRQLTNKVKNEVQDKIKDQVKGKGGELLSGLLGGKAQSSGNPQTTATNNGNSNKTKNAENAVKQTTKKVLGGWFSKKKSADTTKTER